MGLILHREKGVNPHLTYCRRCGGDANEIMLVGMHDGKYQCDICKMMHYGYPSRGRCQNKECGAFQVTKIGVLEDGEKLPAHDPCDSCKKEIAEHKAVVADGGVYWHCTKGHRGVLRASSDLSKLVREKMQIAPPAPCGVEFDEDRCPACHPELIG